MGGPSQGKKGGKARGKNKKAEDAEVKLSRSAGQFATTESARAADETRSLVFQISVAQKWLFSSKSLIMTCITFSFYPRAAGCSSEV